MARVKDTVYRVVRVVSGLPSEAALEELRAAIESFNNNLPIDRCDESKHGIALDPASVVTPTEDNQLTLQFGAHGPSHGQENEL